MKVILLKDIDSLGLIDEVVTVKNGYARNFLIPQKMAVECSTTNEKNLAERLKQKAKKEAIMMQEVQKVINALQHQAIKVVVKAGVSKKIFGRITTVQVAKAIKEQQGFDIDRKKIELNNDIKELGNYEATIHFSSTISTPIALEILGEENH